MNEPTDPPAAEERHADHRFVLANERTYLAYVRTALAMLAAGAALFHVDDLLGSRQATQAVGALVMVAGALTSGAGYLRWRQNDRQIHDDRPLHKTWIPLFLGLAITLLGIVAVVLALA
ncbi:MAG: YidH family protein [Nocardioidaceae bacterium]